MLAKAKGVDPDKYVREKLGDEPTLPDPYAYLWAFYRRLASRRSFNDGIPCSIPYSEMLAGAQLHNVRLDSWEVRILEALDQHERQLIYEQIKQDSK